MSNAERNAGTDLHFANSFADQCHPRQKGYRSPGMPGHIYNFINLCTWEYVTVYDVSCPAIMRGDARSHPARKHSSFVLLPSECMVCIENMRR